MLTDATPWTMTARWIFPADQPPLARGVLTIQDDRILAVEPAGARKADVDLGNAAILPGLVNAHTHLDLSDARGKCPPTPDFTAWLSGVIRHRKQQSVDQIHAAIRSGISESIQYGVTGLGDIAVGGESWEILVSVPQQTRALVFRELLGLSPIRATKETLNAIPWLRAHESTATLRPGVSPHAPYSFDFGNLRFASSLGKVTAIHLAESLAECNLLSTQRGSFLIFLAELDAWDRSGLARNFEQVIELMSGAERLLLVHCNYLQPDVPIPAHAAIVYCPRTHAAFGHPPHPFREFMKRGVRVVLGTDSLASNPDLDILAEARFVAARHPDLPGETLLRMITLDGAIALGWGDVTGSLTPGKSADLVVLPLPEREEPDPYRLVFDSTFSVQRVCFRGNWS